jgi:Holliday junction resolvase RusA-like endonuclease
VREVTVLLDITIPGKPRPQGSLKFVTNPHTGRGIGKYPQHTMDHRNWVISQLIGAWDSHRGPVSEPVAVKCEFTFARPKNHYGTGKNAEVLKDWAPHWMIGAPDTDKLLRLVGDALTIAGVLGDDCQIAVFRGEKRWDSASATRIQVVSL